MAADVPLLLMDPVGEPLGELRGGATTLVARAEEAARKRSLSKRTALPAVLRETLEYAGYVADKDELSTAVRALDAVRRGRATNPVEVRVRRVTPAGANGSPSESPNNGPARKETLVTNSGSETTRFFEVERAYPDDEAHAWYESLVGLDAHKEQLLVELEMLLFPKRVVGWSKKHHGGQVLHLAESLGGRVPLVLLEGDVGTGKTALAETIGDALARSVGGKVRLLKVNTQVRGTGQVGEMSDLIVQAFLEAERRASSPEDGPVLLLLDEADALAASRDAQQMHHEDKAGLNTLLQRLDNLRLGRLPLAAMFVTNRPEALDPAVRRRAALDLPFKRPSDEIRAEIINSAVPELKLTKAQLNRLVRLTGQEEQKNGGVPFTSSDLTDRLLPGALRAAFRDDRPLTSKDLEDQAKILAATPRFGGG